jgi:hypothetical protein
MPINYAKRTFTQAPLFGFIFWNGADASRRLNTPDQQSDLILFLDGQERKGKAVEADLAEFRSSWQRPKWHVLVQEGGK